MSLFTSFLVPIWPKPRQFVLSLALPEDTDGKLNLISNLPTFRKVMHYLTLTNGCLSPASVYNHFNVSGILDEEHFFGVVLTDKQFFSMTQFCFVLNSFLRNVFLSMET